MVMIAEFGGYERAAFAGLGRIDGRRLVGKNWRECALSASAIVAGQEATKNASGFAAWQLGHRHEVSILIVVIGAVGRCRGAEPRSKVSMMIMRPPQQGHGRARVGGSLPSLAPASAGWHWSFGSASSSRARAMLSARVVLANRLP